MRRLALLGSTGSIGRQAVAVAARLPERVHVVGLAARRSLESLCEQARRLAPGASASKSAPLRPVRSGLRPTTLTIS